jgi:hypothetical protein
MHALSRRHPATHAQRFQPQALGWELRDKLLRENVEVILTHGTETVQLEQTKGGACAGDGAYDPFGCQQCKKIATSDVFLPQMLAETRSTSHEVFSDQLPASKKALSTP